MNSVVFQYFGYILSVAVASHLQQTYHVVAADRREIKGIGEKTKETLLKKYKSVKRIKEAPMDELIELIGESKAGILINGLKKPE